MKNRVSVDIVAPGSALVSARGGHSGRVGRDGRRMWIEDADTEEVIGHADSYHAAGEVFARHHGIPDPDVVVVRE